MHTDWTCEKCKKRFGTWDEEDEVTCPKCGHKMDVSETMENLKKIRDEALRELEDDD